MHPVQILFSWLIIWAAGSADYSGEPAGESTSMNEQTLVYHLRYGPVHIGSATLTYLSDQADNCVMIKAEAVSEGVARWFKELHYSLECCMDPATGLPRYSATSFRDRKSQVKNELVFDRTTSQDSTLVICKKTGNHMMQSEVYDVLSGFQYFRQNCMHRQVRKGESVTIKTFHPDKPWDLRIKYAGRERVQTGARKVECYKCSPSTVPGKFFRNNDDMTLWFTCDPSHTPVKFHLNLKIGAIHGELVE